MRVAVVGAGAVGLACARELALRGREVFALEAAPQPGWGTTSRNSEVLHAGLYYPPGSLKARLCVEGRDALYAYLGARGEGVRRCGKLVVATEPAELPALEALAANARAAGAGAVEIRDGADVRRARPAVRCVAALWSPLTGVLDAHGLVRALRADFERAGGELVTRAAVAGAAPRAGGYRLEVEVGGEREELECDAVVNAAGLASDLVARMPLGGASLEEPGAARPVSPADGDLPRLRYVRGSYARLRWPRAADPPPPDCLVYPLPNVGRTGLGIHLTVDLAGGLRLGPDAEEMAERAEDYAVSDEIVPRFEAAARRYLDLPDGVELTPDFAGIRPVRDDATGSRDFYVAEESARGLPGWVNLIGIESPGLTASLAIGRYVADLLEGSGPR